MNGTKLFVNSTDIDLQVTLLLRKGQDPTQSAGFKEFELPPAQSLSVQYGDDTNPFLNGISLMGIFSGEGQGLQEFVVDRSSDLDNRLNGNNRVEFQFENGSLDIFTTKH